MTEDFTDSNLEKPRVMFNELSLYVDATTAFVAVDNYLTDKGIPDESHEQTARQVGGFVIPNTPENLL